VVIGYLIPYFEDHSTFVKSLISKFSVPRQFSDNYFEECSLDFLESEYIRTGDELEDISVELRQPFSLEGRIDNGCKIIGCFLTEQDRRMGMSTYYAALKEKNQIILDELKKIAIENGIGSRVTTEIIEKVDFNISTLCD
jgi:hypothetical protein